MESVKWKVSGMTCSGCAGRIQKYLQQEGMQEVQVDFTSGDVAFEMTSASPDIETIKVGLSTIGYKVLGATAVEPYWTINRKLLWSAVFTLPLVIFHFWMVFDSGFHLPVWIQFVLTIPVYLIGLFHFGKSALGALRQRMTNMDVLIFLGSTAAFLYSLISWWLGNLHDVYFETAASIITLVLLGNYLEKRALSKANENLHMIEEISHELVKKVEKGGHVSEVSTDKIRTGDRIMLGEGDHIPIDGVLAEGELWVDESTISGEALPVQKRIGDELVSGTIIHSGSGVVGVLKVGKSAFIGQLVAMIRKTQSEKPVIHRFSDKVSQIFVPVVIGIALLAFFLNLYAWDQSVSASFLRSVAILVIACPCAMGLAAPTAIVVGSGIASRRGIIFRNAESFESLSGIRQFILDKTGTLTKGDFSVQQITYLTNETDEYLSVVLALENRSNHPIARSLVQHIRKDYPNLPPLRLRKIQVQKGEGVSGEDKSGNQYFIGGEAGQEAVKKVILSRNGEAVLEILVEDALKEGAASLIGFLKANKVQAVILSGDKEENTAMVSSQLGISEYYGGQKPDDKLEKVREIRQRGKTAVAGDGINDAAAIAAADVGIAFSDTSSLNISSADIVLLNRRLDSISKAMEISQKTFRTIRENLFWAFSYNIVAIPLAAIGLLNPMWAAAFMAFSDIVVIGNALRLRYRVSK